MIIKATPKRFTGYLSLKDMDAGIYNPKKYSIIGSGIPDILSGILEILNFKNDMVRVIKPSGFFSASYVLSINQEIQFTRYLVRGCFPINVIAAEFAKNYDCVININNDKYRDVVNYIISNYKTVVQQDDAPVLA